MSWSLSAAAMAVLKSLIWPLFPSSLMESGARSWATIPRDSRGGDEALGVLGEQLESTSACSSSPRGRPGGKLEKVARPDFVPGEELHVQARLATPTGRSNLDPSVR